MDWFILGTWFNLKEGSSSCLSPWDSWFAIFFSIWEVLGNFNAWLLMPQRFCCSKSITSLFSHQSQDLGLHHHHPKGRGQGLNKSSSLPWAQTPWAWSSCGPFTTRSARTYCIPRCWWKLRHTAWIHGQLCVCFLLDRLSMIIGRTRCNRIVTSGFSETTTFSEDLLVGPLKGKACLDSLAAGWTLGYSS